MPEQPKKPKKPILPTLTRLSADALIETIDGPVQIVKLVGKVMPVLTRFASGDLGFRMMTQIREIEPQAERLRLTNGDGQVLCVGREHVFRRADGQEAPASALVEGDELESSWSYPVDYALPDAQEYGAEVRGKPWRPPVFVREIAAIEPGPVFGATVKETKSYYLTFGACSRAQV